MYNWMELLTHLQLIDGAFCTVILNCCCWNLKFGFECCPSPHDFPRCTGNSWKNTLYFWTVYISATELVAKVYCMLIVPSLVLRKRTCCHMFKFKGIHHWKGSSFCRGFVHPFHTQLFFKDNQLETLTWNLHTCSTHIAYFHRIQELCWKDM